MIRQQRHIDRKKVLGGVVDRHGIWPVYDNVGYNFALPITMKLIPLRDMLSWICVSIATHLDHEL